MLKRLNLETIQLLRKLNLKFLNNCEDLISNPDLKKIKSFEEEKEEYLETFFNFLGNIKGDALFIIKEEEKALEKLIPKSIVIQAQKASSAKNNNAENNGFISNKIVDKIKLEFDISLKTISAGGTKSKKKKSTTIKQRINVIVSILRRYFYHQPNIDAVLAEKLIDMKLLKMDVANLYGYKKSERKEPKNGYAPLTKKP